RCALLPDRRGDVAYPLHGAARPTIDFGERGGDLIGELDALGNLIAAAFQVADGAADFILDRLDHAGDFSGRGRGTLGQLAHFVGYHREATALLTRARRLDGGVEREQVGLVGDVLDDLDDATDLGGARRQRIDDTRGLLDRIGD